jgi:polyisoprenoid-binding protein YceI
MTSPIRERPRWRWVVMGVIAAAALAVGGPFVYTSLIRDDAPAPLAAGATQSGAAASQSAADSGGATADGDTSGDIDGRWQVTGGSQAGYRVKEVLLGQATEAVGRTSGVTGEVTIEGARVTKGSLTVDLTSVASDHERRDGQFNGRIMDTATYPTATFALTGPIDVSAVPADGSVGSVKATGKLTLHGKTRAVTTDLKVQRGGDTVNVSGSIPVTFADYNIPNPSFGPVTTEDHGEIEFLVVLSRA